MQKCAISPPRRPGYGYGYGPGGAIVTGAALGAGAAYGAGYYGQQARREGGRLVRALKTEDARPARVHVKASLFVAHLLSPRLSSRPTARGA